MIKIDEYLNQFKEAEGSFAIVDYTYKGKHTTAKGVLESVKADGEILIRHRDDPRTFWLFNLFDVKITNSKFSALKEKGWENG